MVGLKGNRVGDGMIVIKLKYNGHWRTVPRTGRKKYELGN